MRWLIYLILSLVMQVVAWIITPLLPFFSERRMGAWDNGNEQRLGFRLPLWLAWFDTPDNALDGDHNWLLGHCPVTYWSMVGWLYRNSLYGFKLSVLSAPIDKSLIVKQVIYVDWNAPGLQRISMGDYWQWHLVKRIGPLLLNLNFGWLLNDASQARALFMCSPRFRICR